MSICDPTQEKIALGEPLGEHERAHLLGCTACASVAEQYALLEARLDELEHAVPSGFAERVMARVMAEQRAPRLFEQPRLALWFAYAGGAIALANIARFLSSTLLASTGLGGAP
jgi:hypothetical protein